MFLSLERQVTLLLTDTGGSSKHKTIRTIPASSLSGIVPMPPKDRYRSPVRVPCSAIHDNVHAHLASVIIRTQDDDVQL